jgi:osmotically-inducible protein OsmY
MGFGKYCASIARRHAAPGRSYSTSVNAPSRRPCHAELAIRLQTGVTGTRNLIRLKSAALPNEVKRRVEEALERNALTDADQVEVEAQGSEVTRQGTARSFVDLKEA